MGFDTRVQMGGLLMVLSLFGVNLYILWAAILEMCRNVLKQINLVCVYIVNALLAATIAHNQTNIYVCGR